MAPAIRPLVASVLYAVALGAWCILRRRQSSARFSTAAHAVRARGPYREADIVLSAKPSMLLLRGRRRAATSVLLLAGLTTVAFLLLFFVRDYTAAVLPQLFVSVLAVALWRIGVTWRRAEPELLLEGDRLWVGARCVTLSSSLEAGLLPMGEHVWLELRGPEGAVSFPPLLYSGVDERGRREGAGPALMNALLVRLPDGAAREWLAAAFPPARAPDASR